MRLIGAGLLLAMTLSSTLPGATLAAGVPDGLSLSFVVLADGLPDPIYAATTGDGSGRFYVLEKGGRIHVVGADGSVSQDPFLDISDRVQLSFEQGLLGLAFHPDFTENGRFFVDYTRAGDGATVVSEFRAVDGSVDPAAERILFTLPQPGPVHNAGMLAFDSSGMLVVSTGDGGNLGTVGDLGQDPDALYGKILRFDVDADEPTPQILAMGLRNPWRFGIDPDGGHIFIGDVGQGAWEEIDVQPGDGPAANFGWPQMEGPQCGVRHPVCDPGAYQPPVIAHAREGCGSIVGGRVYRGRAEPHLEGLYVYGDWCDGSVWVAPRDEMLMGAATPVRVGNVGGRLMSFAEDDDGELYVIAGVGEGRLMRVTADAAP